MSFCPLLILQRAGNSLSSASTKAIGVAYGKTALLTCQCREGFFPVLRGRPSAATSTQLGHCVLEGVLQLLDRVPRVRSWQKRRITCFGNNRCRYRYRWLGRRFAALVLWLQPARRFGIVHILGVQNERYHALSVPLPTVCLGLGSNHRQIAPVQSVWRDIPGNVIYQVAFPCLAADLAISVSVQLCQIAQQLPACVACVRRHGVVLDHSHAVQDHDA